MALAATSDTRLSAILATRRRNRIRRSVIYLAVLIAALLSINTTIVADTDWERLGSFRGHTEVYWRISCRGLGSPADPLAAGLGDHHGGDPGHASGGDHLYPGDLVWCSQHLTLSAHYLSHRPA